MRKPTGQLISAGQVWRDSLASWWYNWITFLAINTLWVLGTATIILAPPALFGLFYAANETSHKRGASVNDFLKGARLYFFKSWQWGTINVVVTVLAWTNLNFYPQFAGELAAPLLLVTLIVFMLWLTVQLYTIPYLLEQEVKSLRVALRNGLFTALASPLFTLLVLFGIGGVVLACLWNPVVILFGAASLVALAANYAVLDRLAAFGLK